MTMRSRNSRFFAVVCAAVILLGADTGASEETPKPADDPSVVPFDDRIGWLSGCLAIKNHGLEPGTPMTFIIFDLDNERLLDERILTKRVAGRILGKTRSAELCDALHEITHGGNDSEDVSFYEVWFEDIETIDPNYIFGFGILGLDADTKSIDLDGNGVADSFSVCDSLEGLNYHVWSGAPRQGEPIWWGYYYLGYELEGPSDCP